MTEATKYLLDNISKEQKQIITSAINVYGDADHPVADSNTIEHFHMPYIAHCLGRQHRGVIGSALMKAPEFHKANHLKLHEAHSEIIDVMNDAMEFGPMTFEKAAEYIAKGGWMKRRPWEMGRVAHSRHDELFIEYEDGERKSFKPTDEEKAAEDWIVIW